MTAIELKGVTKRFGDVTAIRDVDLRVEEGSVFGFLGPNGAGKSTTIDLLLDYLRPTEGTVRVLESNVQRDPVAVRRRTGILPEAFRPMEHTTGREHVQFAIDARDADDDPDAVLERVGLTDAADRPATSYSKGMAQRMALGMALVGEPDLLILDEPSAGLDPHGVRTMREVVHAERDRGATVFFSSHILSQVEAVADSVGIIQSGELVAVDTIDALRESAGAGSQLSVTLDRSPEGLRDELASMGEITVVSTAERSVTVACPDRRKVDVVDAVRADGASVLDFETSETSLEELFVAHTQGKNTGGNEEEVQA